MWLLYAFEAIPRGAMPGASTVSTWLVHAESDRWELAAANKVKIDGISGTDGAVHQGPHRSWR